MNESAEHAGNSAADAEAGPPISALSRRRRWAFRLIALSLPLVLLALLEGALRLAGYGGHPPILAEVGTVDGKHYISTRDEGISTFFYANADQGGALDRQLFTQPKDPDTVRIFMVGESAMQGYPQPRPLKHSSILQAMLSDLWPERKVEVINLGTTAVASFPVWCIAREALNFDPDLLVVYCGNNEFFGAGGVASTYWLGRSAWSMRVFHNVRRLAVVQVLLARLFGAGGAENSPTLMEAVIAEAQIGPQDPRRAAVAANLAYNLRAIKSACARRGVPLVLCTCPGNERGLAPLGEDVAPPLSESDAAHFDELLRFARARAGIAPAEALARLDEAARLAPEHATLHYVRAQCLAALGRDQEAAAEYARALDLDTMPWRSPSATNAAIRSVAGDGAVLCDLERAFREASPGGSIGWELMDDHVHPSLAGQALIARTLIATMQTLPAPLHVDAQQAAALPDWQVYAERLGRNPLDAYRVLYRVTDLLMRPFFKRSNPEALSRFLAEQRRMEAQFDDVTMNAIRNLQQKRIGVPITGGVGEAQFRAGQFAAAAANLELAERSVPPLAFFGMRYGCLALEARRRAGLAENPELLARMLDAGHVLQGIRGARTNVFDAYYAWALGRSGRHAAAVQLGEPMIRELDDPYRHILAGQLAVDLAELGRADDARRLLRDLHIKLEDLGLDSAVSARLSPPPDSDR